MNKKALAWMLAALALGSSAHGGELEDLQLIKRAYDDQLYLFVEEKALAFLSNDGYDSQGSLALEAQTYLIAALVERGAYDEALQRLALVKVDDRLTYFKARALFGAYVERGLPLPEGKMRPSSLLASVTSRLNGYDKVMGEYVRSQDLFEFGEYNKSSSVLKNIIDGERLFRHYEAAKFLYGRSLYHEDPPRYIEALDVFKSLSAKYGRSILASRYEFWQGECYFELNRLQEAESAFQRALSLDPDEETVVDLRYNLGWLYTAMGRLEDAIVQLETVLKEPTGLSKRYQPSVRYKLASLRLMQKKPQECLTLLAPILQNSPLEFEASLLAAQAAMSDFKWEASLEYLSHARLSPVPEIYLEAGRLLGKVHLELGHHNKAETILISLIEHEVPLDFRIDVQLQLADVYYAMGDVYHSQDIYRQLLIEKSRKLEPMLHYNLARCAMRSNPLVECVYRRDFLLQQKESGRMAEADFIVEKDILGAKIRQVMSRMWIMSTTGSSRLAKSDILLSLESLSGLNIAEKEKEILASYQEQGNQVPSDIGMESAIFTALVESFVEAFWKKDAIAPYSDVLSSLGVLGNYYPTLQVTSISQHLDHIIGMGEESPYLSLAYYEKFQLYRQQGLTGDALESLHHAIEHTVEPHRRSGYLLQLARTEIQLARGIEGDPKTTKFKIKKALDHLEEVEKLSQENSPELVDLRFTGYRLLLDYDKAEATLVNELSLTRDPMTIRRFEEQLISFYHAIQRPIKAAQRRLLYAGRLDSIDVVEAQHQRYEAGVTFLESEQGHDEGVEWLKKLANASPSNEWTLRAGLKCVDIYQRSNQTQEAEALLTKMSAVSGSLELPLRLEIKMTEGRQALYGDKPLDAAKAFQEVMAQSDELPAIKSSAALELGKALKNVDPMRAADVFLQFYYLFPQHVKNQEALYESCRLQASLLKKTDMSEKDLKIKELRRLVDKLTQERDRQNLNTFLDNI